MNRRLICHWSRVQRVAFCNGHNADPRDEAIEAPQAPLASQILRPGAAMVGEVVAMGDQPLMQMAGERRDAAGPRLVPEEVSGHADLPTAAGAQDRLIEPGPLPNAYTWTGRVGAVWCQRVQDRG